MDFEILSEITGIEEIARGTAVRNRKRLRRVYGGRAWRKMKGLARVRFAGSKVVSVQSTRWHEVHDVGKKCSKSSFANPSRGGFVMCVDNTDYPALLEVGKVYRTLPAHTGVPRGLLRVVEESGEDYLYPVKRFVPIELPPRGRRVLISGASG